MKFLIDMTKLTIELLFKLTAWLIKISVYLLGAFFSLLASLFTAALALAASVCDSRKDAKLRRTVLDGTFISSEDFEDNWIIAREGQGSLGYKYNDTSGCYVILIFGQAPNAEFSNYENSYIGQSNRICERVHNHFNGKGNGDVYADRKYGKRVFVRFIPCAKQDMDNLEKSLIAAFNSTASYNKTSGGSRSV